MFKDKRILAIVPARAGSKGIPEKNIKPLCGKPLIEWTIEPALASKHIDDVMVSTDSERIAALASDCGVQVPFLRPAELALDETPGADVILHVLQWYEEVRQTYDCFILLQPTSPFRKISHMDDAIEVCVNDQDADAVVSICEVDDHPYWMKVLDENRRIKTYVSEDQIPSSRQKLPKLYKNNGAIYICTWDAFLEDRSFYKRNCKGFIMNKQSSIDLDTLDDWEYAEYRIQRDAHLRSGIIGNAT